MTEVLVKGIKAAALAAFVFALGSFAAAQAQTKRVPTAQTAIRVTQIGTNSAALSFRRSR